VANITNIPAPRVPFIDERTGLISREWFRFLNNQFVLTGSGTTATSIADLEVGLGLSPDTDDVTAVLQSEIQALNLHPPAEQRVFADYGMFYDTTTQAPAVINTAYPVTFNTTAYSRGTRRGATTSQIFCNNAGLYNFQFSIQFDKTSGGDSLAYVWFRRNGVDIADSASQIRIKGNNAEIFVAANIFQEMSNGDYVQLMWSADDLDIRMLHEAAAAPHPAVPSVILTVNQVSL